jgi:hypothetical protein
MHHNHLPLGSLASITGCASKERSFEVFAPVARLFERSQVRNHIVSLLLAWNPGEQHGGPGKAFCGAIMNASSDFSSQAMFEFFMAWL